MSLRSSRSTTLNIPLSFCLFLSTYCSKLTQLSSGTDERKHILEFHRDSCDPPLPIELLRSGPHFHPSSCCLLLLEMTQPKVLLLTGGAWWSSTTPNNLGHQFLLHTLATSEKRDYPLKIYICTRTPPPAGALEEYENRFRVSRDGENSDSHQSTLHHLPLDLSSPSSIRQCVARFSSLEDRLDFLVLNAAVAPSARHLSSYTITLPSVTPCPEGDDPDDAEPKSERRWQVEDTFLVNVLGNGMLWQLLEPAMKQPSIDDQVGEEDRVRARVVVVSSELHRRCQAIKGKVPSFASL